MFSKSLVDQIRAEAVEAGVPMPMSKGRDLVSRMLTGKSFSQAMAADRDGKLVAVSYDEQRNEDLRANGGSLGWAVDRLAPIVQHFALWAEDRLTLLMRATTAIRQRQLPPVPELTWPRLDAWLASQQLGRSDIEIVQAPWHRGRHLSFVGRGHWWYLVDDQLLEDAHKRITADLTVVLDEAVIFHPGMDHTALRWDFHDGHWSLAWRLHRIATDDDLELTFEQLANR